MLKLHVREIVATLPDDSPEPATDPAPPLDDHDEWRNSSLDLERGLDVLELPIDIATPVPADEATVEPRVPPER